MVLTFFSLLFFFEYLTFISPIDKISPLNSTHDTDQVFMMHYSNKVHLQVCGIHVSEKETLVNMYHFHSGKILEFRRQLYQKVINFLLTFSFL